MSALAAAPICTGPQAVPCLGVLAAITLGGLVLGMSPSPEEVEGSDETAGKDLADSNTENCVGDCAEECLRLSQEIESQAMVVQRRLEDLVEDQHDLYNTARRIKDNWGKGSWEGHIDFYDDERGKLKTMIAVADSKNCHVDDTARAISEEEPPTRPGW